MNALTNAARGEVALTIDGAQRRLCLTLGALAELETAFDAISLAELGERLGHLSAQDLLIVLAALLAGGGFRVSPGELANARIDLREAAGAVGAAFNAAFGDAS